MNDAGHAIQIDIQSAPISALEQSNGNVRYVLGYISGEFTKNITTENLYVVIWFKRGLDMEWENIRYKLNRGRKIFRQKILDKRKQPQQLGLIVTEFYVQLYGWIAPNMSDPDLTAEFELTDFELSIKEIPIGKHAGEVLGVDTEPEIPDPPVIPAFLMFLDMVGEVQASSARAVWYTTHPATTRVIYGRDPLAMGSQVQDISFSEFHDILIPGLSVNQLYYAQFFSISQITGEEISSDIKSFFTGEEINIVNILTNPAVEMFILQTRLLELGNTLEETESLLQLIPDGDNEAMFIGGNFTTHSRVDLVASNTISSNYDYSVT